MVNTGFAVLGAGLRFFLEGLAEASAFQGSPFAIWLRVELESSSSYPMLAAWLAGWRNDRRTDCVPA